MSARFEAFWAAYPRRVGRVAAETSWAKLAPDEELTSRIIRAVELQCSHTWRGRDPEYIPHPRTWLNQKRWEDEIVTTPVGQVNRPLPRAQQAFLDGAREGIVLELAAEAEP